MAFPLALVAGLGQAGMGIFGSMSQRADEAAQTSYQNTFQNLMIDAQNRRQKDLFGRQIDQFRTQQGFNADAANRAYEAEQRRLNEQFTSAAFQRQGMLQSLLEAQGENNAEMRFGNSARRANLLSTLGNYGRNQAMLAESLASARNQSSRNMQEIGRQHLSADYQGWQGVSLPPMPEMNVPMPRMSNNNMMLGIGNSLMSGLSTFASLKAPSSGGGFGGLPTAKPAFTLGNISSSNLKSSFGW
jgi:hypothetical protein